MIKNKYRPKKKTGENNMAAMNLRKIKFIERMFTNHFPHNHYEIHINYVNVVQNVPLTFTLLCIII